MKEMVEIIKQWEDSNSKSFKIVSIVCKLLYVLTFIAMFNAMLGYDRQYFFVFECIALIIGHRLFKSGNGNRSFFKQWTLISVIIAVPIMIIGDYLSSEIITILGLGISIFRLVYMKKYNN